MIILKYISLIMLVLLPATVTAEPFFEGNRHFKLNELSDTTEIEEFGGILVYYGTANVKGSPPFCVLIDKTSEKRILQNIPNDNYLSAETFCNRFHIKAYKKDPCPTDGSQYVLGSCYESK